MNGRHLCGASRSGPVPRKLDWRDSARSGAPPGSRPTMVRQGENPRGQRHCEVTYRRCAKGFRRSGAVLVDRRVAKISGSSRRSSRKRAASSAPEMARRSGPVKNVALDGAAGGGGPRGSCPREAGRQIPTTCGEKLDRERQRQDDDLHSRPITPLRKERCSESSVRSSSGPGWAWLRGKPRRLFGVLAEAGASTSIEAPLDHAVCQGFGRAGGVEAALFGESSGGR